jgi:isopentenyl-diphosphate delta-isomerase
MDMGQRKREHVELALKRGSQAGANGFERYRLVPRSFPELARDQVVPDAEFLGRRLAMPLIISSMTGGGGSGAGLNRILAAAAQKHGIALGLGSLRAALVDPSCRSEFDVRGAAPDVPLLGNIGAWQLREPGLPDRLLELAASLRLDGLFVHVNAAQELVQPEGDADFSAALDAVCRLARSSPIPVLVKEVGFGLALRSGEVGLLAAAGVAGFDVAGAGGTSFLRIEAERAGDEQRKRLAEDLGQLAVPTAVALRELAQEICTAASGGRHGLAIIASGGIRSPVDMALALGLGATLAGMAQPVLAAAVGGAERLDGLLSYLRFGLRSVMLLCGCRKVEELRGRVVEA